MKRARRFPQRLVRWTSLCVCFALVLSALALVPFQVSTGKNAKVRSTGQGEQGSSPNGQGRRVAAPQPQPGPPMTGLPNLDDLRRAPHHSPHAPAPIPSTQRRWRHGQRAQRAAIDSKSSGVRANHVLGTIAEPQGTSDMAMARIDPRNRMGTGGVDLLSNNFNWSLGLVGLSGRGGLDLGLALSYNSLATWTQSGNYIAFDMDQSDPSPGFRIGFPVVQGPYYNNLASAYFYILITPSGQHVELRQISTYVYQAVDATYSQLTVNSGYLTFLAQGAQLTFYPNPANTEYHCTQVKDRNGNYLTINYAGTEDIQTVTDTLGRVVTFNYDGNGNIQSITQPWNGQAHQWATFGWGSASIGNNFSSSMTYAGPTPGTTIPVLTRVGLADGSSYTFEYNNSYGMVSTIRYFGYDNRPLRYTTYVAPANTTDCPRVTEQHEWADWWNGMNNVPSEVVTQYAHDGSGCVMTAPDGTIYKAFYGSGWQAGLTTQEEFWSGGVKKKWTATTWDQDNTSLGYPNNPRLTQTDIWDAEYNHKHTRTDYVAYNLADGTTINLPQNSYEYQSNATTVLRRAHVDYNTSTTYTSRRIIGLPTENTLYEVDPGTGIETLMSKIGFAYDESGSLQGADAPVQHDGANFGASLVAGRGNLSSVKRYDVTNTSQFTTSSVQYNTAGAVATSTDPLNHPSSIEYSATYAYAYPTTMHDPDNNQSFAQYNFDTGAVTRTDGPPPAGQSQGASQTMTYDSAGRISRVDNLNNGAYSRWEYGSWVVGKYDTVQAGQGERQTVTILNGFGGGQWWQQSR